MFNKTPKTYTLQTWLNDATSSLSDDSGNKVRETVTRHYEHLTNRFISDGRNEIEAEQLAILEFGSPQKAAKKLEKKYTTSLEQHSFERNSKKTWKSWIEIIIGGSALYYFFPRERGKLFFVLLIPILNQIIPNRITIYRYFIWKFWIDNSIYILVAIGLVVLLSLSGLSIPNFNRIILYGFLAIFAILNMRSDYFRILKFRNMELQNLEHPDQKPKLKTQTVQLEQD